MEDDEINFPRGKGQVKRKAISSPPKKKLLKKKQKTIENAGDIIPSSNKVPQKVDFLRSSAMDNETYLLGFVKEINDLYISVSLPHNFKGHLKITQLTDTLLEKLENEFGDDDENDEIPRLEDFLSIGQMIPCNVLDHEQKGNTHIVQVTTRESYINEHLTFRSLKKGMSVYGSIKSVEDHGYIVSLGIRNCNAFLPKKTDEDGPRLRVGTPMNFIITSVKKDSNTVFLSDDMEKISSYITKSSSIIDLNSLNIGMLVKATVDKVLSNGLWLKFLDYFHGTVDIFHLGKYISSEKDIAEEYKVGTKLLARILFINKESKKIGLSLQPHIIEMTQPKLENIEIGRIFENAVVQRIDNLIGISLALPLDDSVAGKEASTEVEGEDQDEGQSTVPAYVHISRTSNDPVKKLDKKFYVGQTVQCRVIGTSYVDGFIDATMKKEDLEEKLMRYDDVHVGDILDATIVVVHNRGMELKLSKRIKAFCPRSHLSDIAVTDPESRFKKDTKVKIRVLSVDTRNRKIIVTAKKTLVTSNLPLITSFEGIKDGQFSHGYIITIKSFGCIVGFFNNVKGVVPIHELTTSKVDNPLVLFKPGQVMKCRVIASDAGDQKLILSFNPKSTKKEPKEKDPKKKEKKVSPGSVDDLKEGQIIKGKVDRVILNNGLSIQIFPRIYGRVFITDISDNYKEDPLSEWSQKTGTEVECYIMAIKKTDTGTHIDLSMRNSRLNPYDKSNDSNKNPEIIGFDNIAPGKVVYGYVKNIVENMKTVFVSLSRNISARVIFHNLSDSFVKNPSKKFPVGSLVKGKITKIDKDSNRVEMTLKESEVQEDSLTILDLKIGMTVKGWVRRVEKFGIFINIKNSSLSGLCHISEVDDKQLSPDDLEKLFKKGDYVRALIKKTNPEKNQVSLSMKPSNFDDEDSEMEIEESVSGEESDDSSVSQEVIINQKTSTLEDSDDGSGDEEGEESSESGDDDSSSSDDDEPAASDLNWGDLTFKDSGKKNRKEEILSDLEDSSDDEDDGEKKKKSKKDVDDVTKEKEIERKEMSLLDSSRPLESIDDFERELLRTPNSSFVWIKYISFHAYNSNIQKAREIAEKAIKSIDPREEAEILNIWIAYLNLENLYGNKDSQEKLFKRAVQHNEPKRMYREMIKIQISSNKSKEAEELHKVLIKKFKTAKKCWLDYAKFKYTQSNFKEARAILDRSLKSLPKRKHIQTIIKFAQMEYKIGEPEIGRTMFENLISTYPKKIDIWSVYIDMETVKANYDRARDIFERVLTLKLSSKKQRFFFKKYFKFEVEHGDEDRLAHVKSLLLESLPSDFVAKS